MIFCVCYRKIGYNFLICDSPIFKDLSEAQKRRLLMYYIGGLSEEQIAAKENVSQQAVSKSLKAAKKILEKFFKNRL